MIKRIVPYFRYMEIKLPLYQHFRIFPFAWLIVAQDKSESTGKIIAENLNEKYRVELCQNSSALF